MKPIDEIKETSICPHCYCQTGWADEGGMTLEYCCNYTKDMDITGYDPCTMVEWSRCPYRIGMGSHKFIQEKLNAEGDPNAG